MRVRLPEWFKQKIPNPEVMGTIKELLDGLNLHTICQNALCPNIGECFSRNTLTFLILGDVCTRNCTFCAVKKGIAPPVDEDEPQHVYEAVKRIGLSFVVITSVSRDDLADGGAYQFVKVINMLHRIIPPVAVEVLVPDFLGSKTSIKAVVEARPEIISHNMETVARLYPKVRPGADYDRSTELLFTVKRLDPTIVTKSGLMLGLGETKDEVITVMKGLRGSGCDLLTIGQYLAPSDRHYPMARFVPPEEFSEYESIGRDMGFARVVSAPLVRSSFKAAELYAVVNH